MAAAPHAQLESLIGAFSPAVQATAQDALRRMRARLRGAVETVYDNYNALAIAFGATDRRTDVILSITLYPRWVSLFFAHGADLDDPQQLLRGSGSTVRHIVLEDPAIIDGAPVRALIAQALQGAAAIDGNAKRSVVIKSIAKQRRPRRPAAAKPARSTRRAEASRE